MSDKLFQHVSEFDHPVPKVFSWHERPGAIERMTPPWQPMKVLERQGSIRDGDRTVLELQVGPISRRWVAEHEDFEKNRRFRDRQTEGPFRKWIHTHRFASDGNGSCELTDEIRFRLPLGPIGAMFGGGFVRRQLEQAFRYRHRTLGKDLEAHGRYDERPRLRVGVTGGGGLIGTALRSFLRSGGHEVVRIHRPGPGTPDGAALWAPTSGILTPERLEGLDALVHLAGESIAGGRWTRSKMQAIRDSRVVGTRSLVRSLLDLDAPPKTLISASAIGIYGDRGEQILHEESAAGSGFLADVAREWEQAALPASEAGVRVVNTRFGVVLDPRDGALAAMMPPFRFGAGGPVGSGRQFWSWVSLEDAVGAVHHALLEEDVQGPVNVVAPEAVTNRRFASTLGRVLRRPAIAPLPAPVARLVLGKMADELLLSSTRVQPRVLEGTGYRFRDPGLETALRWMLGRIRDEDVEAA